MAVCCHELANIRFNGVDLILTNIFEFKRVKSDIRMLRSRLRYLWLQAHLRLATDGADLFKVKLKPVARQPGKWKVAEALLENFHVVRCRLTNAFPERLFPTVPLRQTTYRGPLVGRWR